MTASTADLDIAAALDDIAAFRSGRLRLVVATAILSIFAVGVGSWHISFEVIGGDQATMALLPTFAFLAGIAVLLTALVYLLAVRSPVRRLFRQRILGPLLASLADGYRDESKRQLERGLWENSELFDEEASQRANRHFQALRVGDLTVGWCQLRLNRPLRGGDDDFDGIFMVATADERFTDAVQPLYRPGDDAPYWLGNAPDDLALAAGDGALYLAMNTPLPAPATHPRDDDPTPEDFRQFQERQRLAIGVLQEASNHAG